MTPEKNAKVSRCDFVKVTGSAAIATGVGLGLPLLQDALGQGNQRYNALSGLMSMSSPSAIGTRWL